jgi:DNA replication protein DnaC
MPEPNVIQEAAFRVLPGGDDAAAHPLCGCGRKVICFHHGDRVVYGTRCAECQSAADAEEREREERDRRDAADERWLEWSGIRPRFRTASFELCDERNAEIVNRCRSYAASFAAGETTGGLMLMGPIGTGKTFLAVALLRALRLSWPACEQRDNPPSYLVNAVELVDAIVASWKRNEGEPREYSWARDAQLTVLDDLGLEADKEWAARQLYQLINHRYEYQLPTIVTSNATMKDLTDRLGARTVSRLVEMCEPLKLAGRDRRTERRVRERADLA